MSQNREQLTEDARDKSRSLRRYAAVVEVVNYRTGSSRMAVAVGVGPIRTRQMGCEFIGVVCQFHQGDPCPIQ